MNINGIDSTLIPNIPIYGVQTKSSSDNHDNSSVQEQIESDNLAVIASISEEGKRFSEMKLYKSGEGPANMNAYFQNREAREQEIAALRKEREEKAQNEIDPFDDPFQMMCVSYEYPPGTLGEYIKKNLEGKAINPSLVASEMVRNISGSVYNPNATVEERAINRETALRHIEYIAQNYFSDPDEAQAFVDGVKGFAEKDIMREKGYIVADNSDMAPFRSYGMGSNYSKGSINFNEYAKKYGTSMDELKANPEKLAAFNIALGKYQDKWYEEIVKDFEDNEKRVADIIAKVKGSLSETAVNDSLQRILKAFVKPDN